MPDIRDYKDLIVWQKSRLLVKEVYTLIRQLPREEQYALTSQIQRAAVSIPSNIAEGYGRNYRTEYIRFLILQEAPAMSLKRSSFCAWIWDIVQNGKRKAAFPCCMKLNAY